MALDRVTEELEVFKTEDAIAEPLVSGTNGLVYLLPPDNAVKFSKYSCIRGPSTERMRRFAIKKLKKEELIARTLYENRGSAPAPNGVFMVPLNYGAHGLKSFPGYVMQYIEGITFDKIPDEVMESHSLQERVNEELECSRQLGLIPWDLVKTNFLWRESDDKVFLIDFGHWEFQDGA
jgi:tRNA A-37 threonylcarbamoyl transferase component Bud32